MRTVLALLTLMTSPALAGQRVVGGNPADPGEWPDTVAVKLQGTYQCTGILVAPRVVLTAAHCNANITDVLIGSTDYSDPELGEAIPVVAVYEYPDPYRTFDVAALVLERDASVPPRAVATSCVLDNHLFDGATVAPVGFGATESWGGGGNSLLMEARTVITDSDCSELRRGCNDAARPAGELIAGGDGIDSCNGDSGGPLYLDTPDGWFLVGITSRAAEPASVACGDGGVYVRADAIIGWAEAQTGLDITRPDCGSISPAENRPPAPSDVDLDLEAGTTESVQLDPNDPDTSQTHAYELITAPSVGTAIVSAEGIVRYTAPFDFTGETSMTVRITDDGSPAASADVTVGITVREPSDGEDPGDTGDTGEAIGTEVDLTPGGCSCRHTPAPLGIAWLAPLLFWRRRRP